MRQASALVPVERIVDLFGGECFTVSDLQQVGMPLVYVSPEFHKLTGYDHDEASGRDLGFLQHSDTEQQGNRQLREAIRKGEPCTVILRNYRKDGSLFWNEQSHYPVRNEAGEVTNLVTVQRDVSHRVNAAMSQDVGEAMARYLEEEGRFFGYSLLLRDGHEPSVAWLSDAAKHLVGTSATEIRERGLASIVHPDDRSLFERRLGRIRRSVARHEGGLPTRIFRDRYRLVTASGKVLWVEDAASVAWESTEAGVTAIHAVVRDITSLRKSQHEFWQLSHFDALTGLPNRNLLDDRLQQAIVRARREGLHVALMMMDLVEFRLSSEAMGSGAGDRQLKRLADDLRRGVRRSDTLARFDGDTFVLMVPDLQEPEDFVAVLDKLSRLLGSAPPAGAVRPTNPAPVVGVAIASGDGGNAEDLIDAATEAVKRARASGQGGYVLHESPLGADLSERLGMQQDIARALRCGELVLHYQPRVQLASGETTGVEALLRWVHPELGLLKPAEFIGRIRSLDLVQSMFAWVLDEACRQAGRWAADRSPHRVAVNVPAAALADPSFVGTVKAALTRWDLHPALLELELQQVPTSGASRDREVDKLTELRELGVRISLDDFGVTATALDGLGDLPLDTLKIAGTFQRDLTGPDRAVKRALLAAIIALAKSLRLRVVAEWVETPEQRRILQELGCDEAQGFLFGHAIPAEHMSLGQVRAVDSGS